MNEDIASTPSTPEQRLELLEADNRALRLQFLLALAILVLFCLSLNVFLFRQTSGVRKQTTDAEHFVANYNTNTAPQLGVFVGRLQDYAKRDPEFQRLLARYINAPDAAAAPAQAPVAAPFGK